LQTKISATVRLEFQEASWDVFLREMKEDLEMSETRRKFLGTLASVGSRATIASSILGLGLKKARAVPVAPCFLPGTRILTDIGYVPIENLKRDDLVLTRAGKLMPIRKIQHHYPAKQSVVCIKRFAIDDATPDRDLYVTAGHRLYVGGYLINASRLVNDTTVVRHEMRSIETLHVELDTHQVIYAEGLEVESSEIGGEPYAPVYSRVNELKALTQLAGITALDPVQTLRMRIVERSLCSV
jgi:hypothetical protein